jgi:hypothetical protein
MIEFTRRRLHAKRQMAWPEYTLEHDPKRGYRFSEKIMLKQKLSGMTNRR